MGRKNAGTYIELQVSCLSKSCQKNIGFWGFFFHLFAFHYSLFSSAFICVNLWPVFEYVSVAFGRGVYYDKNICCVTIKNF